MTMFKQGDAPITGSFELCPKCRGFVKIGEQCSKCLTGVNLNPVAIPEKPEVKKEITDAVGNSECQNNKS